MKPLLAAIALIVAFSVVAPAATAARAPEARRAWGCFFTAANPGFIRFVPGFQGPSEFGAFFKLGGCDRERHFLVVTHLAEVIEGTRVTAYRNEHDVTVGPKHQERRFKRLPRWVFRNGPVGRGERIEDVNFKCDADQEQGTFLFRMTVKRKHHPGIIRLRSKPMTWPCKNAPFDERIN